MRALTAGVLVAAAALLAPQVLRAQDPPAVAAYMLPQDVPRFGSAAGPIPAVCRPSLRNAP